LEVGGDHLFQPLLETIARNESCLVELISGNLGAGTEFLGADRADGKLPACHKGCEVKEVSTCKANSVRETLNFTQISLRLKWVKKIGYVVAKKLRVYSIFGNYRFLLKAEIGKDSSVNKEKYY
jgi:hypothetical protein